MAPTPGPDRRPGKRLRLGPARPIFAIDSFPKRLSEPNNGQQLAPAMSRRPDQVFAVWAFEPKLGPGRAEGRRPFRRS